MKVINNLYKIVFLGLLAAFFSGCTSMQSMSSYARTGDTVTVALGGSEDNNALVEILKKEDIVVKILDSNAVEHTVKLRHLFRVYPDHGSAYVYNTRRDASGSFWDTQVPPLLGQWLATIDLVDPVTGVVPPLAVGPATISVTSAVQLKPTVYYGFNYDWTNGSLAAIDIEILPGTGTANTLNYTGPVSFDPITAIEPLPQIMVKPSAAPINQIAGGSFQFVYDQANFAPGIVVVPANHDPNVQITSNITTLADGNKQLDVTILNPRGFLNNNNRTGADLNGTMAIGKMSPLRSVGFNLLFRAGAVANDDINWQSYIQMTSGQYIDLAGNAVTDITPVMKKTR